MLAKIHKNLGHPSAPARFPTGHGESCTELSVFHLHSELSTQSQLDQVL